MKSDVDDILRQSNLSSTGSRRKMLELFITSNKALAHADFEKLSGEHFDRVTIYRTLQTFVEKGIIHSIPTADNSVLYALCKDECSSSGHHNDDHVHFVCDECGITYCLDQINIPSIILPKGFRAAQINLLVNGVCNKCN